MLQDSRGNMTNEIFPTATSEINTTNLKEEEGEKKGYDYCG